MLTKINKDIAISSILFTTLTANTLLCGLNHQIILAIIAGIFGAGNLVRITNLIEMKKEIFEDRKVLTDIISRKR